MPAEVALEDAAVRGPVEERAPGLELAHPVGCLARVQLGHAPVVHVLAAAHRVGEVHPPVVAVVHVAERRGHAALGHDRVRLAEERLAHQPDLRSGSGRGDCGTEPGAAGTDHQHVVVEGLVLRHERKVAGHQSQVGKSQVTVPARDRRARSDLRLVTCDW